MNKYIKKIFDTNDFTDIHIDMIYRVFSSVSVFSKFVITYYIKDMVKSYRVRDYSQNEQISYLLVRHIAQVNEEFIEKCVYIYKKAIELLIFDREDSLNLNKIHPMLSLILTYYRHNKTKEEQQQLMKDLDKLYVDTKAYDRFKVMMAFAFNDELLIKDLDNDYLLTLMSPLMRDISYFSQESSDISFILGITNIVATDSYNQSFTNFYIDTEHYKFIVSLFKKRFKLNRYASTSEKFKYISFIGSVVFLYLELALSLESIYPNWIIDVKPMINYLLNELKSIRDNHMSGDITSSLYASFIYYFNHVFYDSYTPLLKSIVDCVYNDDNVVMKLNDFLDSCVTVNKQIYFKITNHSGNSKTVSLDVLQPFAEAGSLFFYLFYDTKLVKFILNREDINSFTTIDAIDKLFGSYGHPIIDAIHHKGSNAVMLQLFNFVDITDVEAKCSDNFNAQFKLQLLLILYKFVEFHIFDYIDPAIFYKFMKFVDTIDYSQIDNLRNDQLLQPPATKKFISPNKHLSKTSLEALKIMYKLLLKLFYNIMKVSDVDNQIVTIYKVLIKLLLSAKAIAPIITSCKETQEYLRKIFYHYSYYILQHQSVSMTEFFDEYVTTYLNFDKRLQEFLLIFINFSNPAAIKHPTIMIVEALNIVDNYQDLLSTNSLFFKLFIDDLIMHCRNYNKHQILLPKKISSNYYQLLAKAIVSVINYNPDVVNLPDVIKSIMLLFNSTIKEQELTSNKAVEIILSCNVIKDYLITHSTEGGALGYE